MEFLYEEGEDAAIGVGMVANLEGHVSSISQAKFSQNADCEFCTDFLLANFQTIFWPLLTVVAIFLFGNCQIRRQQQNHQMVFLQMQRTGSDIEYD